MTAFHSDRPASAEFNPTVRNRARYIAGAYLDRRQGYDPDGLAEALRSDPAATLLAIGWHLGLWLMTLRGLAGFILGGLCFGGATTGGTPTPLGYGLGLWALWVLCRRRR